MRLSWEKEKMDNDHHDDNHQDQKHTHTHNIFKSFITYRILFLSGHLLINFERLLKVQPMLILNVRFLLEWLLDLIQLFQYQMEIINYLHVQSYYFQRMKVFYKFIISFVKTYIYLVENLK